MTTSKRRNTLKFLADKEARDEYVAAHIETGVAFQIKANRLSRDLTQTGLGTLADMKQTAISRLEGGGSLPNLETLARLASAFDVALIVRFVPFSDLIDWADGLGTRPLEVPSFADDLGLKLAAPSGATPRVSSLAMAKTPQSEYGSKSSTPIPEPIRANG